MCLYSIRMILCVNPIERLFSVDVEQHKNVTEM